MASLPSPGDNHKSSEGRSERTQCQTKMAAWNSFSYICTRALHSFRSFAQPPPSYLCCQRPPSHHSSSLTSVSLVPVLHWLQPSTPFWPYELIHEFFPHAQTISILSNLLYSLTLFLIQVSYAPVRSFLRTLSIRDTPTKLLKHFISRTFTFLLSALLIPPYLCSV